MDSNILFGTYRNKWDVLCEKGYQGIKEHVRAVHRKRKLEMEG